MEKAALRRFLWMEQASGPASHPMGRGKRMQELQQGVQFRFAGPEDTALILRFIRALARYEGMEAQVVADEAMLEEWLFQRKKAEVLFCPFGWDGGGLRPVFP